MTSRRIADAVTVTTVMTSGRPVLAIPFAGDSPTIGERVLVAWNASREAARAVNDALPLLTGAKQVTVLAINPQRGVGGHMAMCRPPISRCTSPATG